MSDIQDVLGVDIDTLEWGDLALCNGSPTNMFYDDYESDPAVAKVVDQMCLSCPVVIQCLERGLDNSEWGVWGGIYLTSGKPDINRNTHKTQEVWENIRSRIGDAAL